MRVSEEIFNVFDRESFKYRTDQPDSDQVRNEYQTAWNQWKDLIQNNVYPKLGDKFIVEPTESWQNSGSLRQRFWTRIKTKGREKSASCIAAMINVSSLRVYLEWHDYKSENSTNNVEQHNEWVKYVKEWAQKFDIDIKQYSVWISGSTSAVEDKTIPLEAFIKDTNKHQEMIIETKENSGSWLRIGRIISKAEVLSWVDASFEIAEIVFQLEWLYDKTNITEMENQDRRYWLFNTYYAKYQEVWMKSKEIGVASMQYEIGIQKANDITRNVNVMKQIALGDYVIAYTGDKGFLGIGKVTREFFEETDPNKYIAIGENNWRQRIGIDWLIKVDKPVYYRGENFKSKVGLINENAVMGSYVIFEISKLGFKFIKSMLENSRYNKQGSEKMKYTFADYVAARGFKFDEDVLHNYIICLMSKPFVILSGISGTGKTKIAQFFAEYMCPDEEKTVDDVAEVDDDPFSFIYKIQPYNLKYKQLIIPQKYAKLLDLPNEGSSKHVTVKFIDIQDECRIYNAPKGDYRQLSLTGKIGEYIKNNCSLDGYIKISFEKEDDKDVIVFKHVSTEKKKVKTRSSRYAFISVRPDWVDNRSLLGFFNPITEKYQATELLKLMLRAKEDKNKPYFVILDEMNLAKVEYYFSDFLSCLESRRIGLDGEVRSESIKLHDCEEEVLYVDEDGKEYIIPARLEIPFNIYFTGTVNVDETTYMFSPKVLDRGNVIEFNEVDLNYYGEMLWENEQNENDIHVYADSEFVSGFTDDFQYHNKLIEKQFNLDSDSKKCFEHIVNINNILKKYNLHFGYRVVDEVLYYLTNARKTDYFEPLKALDYQIIQRILPKMYGNRRKLEAPLTELLAYCFGWEINDLIKKVHLQPVDQQYISAKLKEESMTEEILKSQFAKHEIRFKKTAVKLYRMLILLKDNGFVSFIE
ncbi:5-methylcytosine-specific restriction endonuclease McrBC, GTP-binding regulatory subunit McrB [Natronincola peptidivorans]|uniref:5-methylcytosine-specific restriction endonuclease McrBC, GTP-binding regulatory subunit McrB n=1 Tax=Natronincola peptidivorans TaxID=426128 RepID=A0A1I0ELT4_9FIRM|nr:HI_0552 family protein [Natronincola peptidivorans]SET45502.1 5-methylcytosine-specific restriction endonuclease McrBC, GTP-binding regulatory subunit McrB [Natronincola peptidivorans]